ncbi:MAG: type II CAAX endopeptidase family protein [Candidatus Saccharimonadales bacterium]
MLQNSLNKLSGERPYDWVQLFFVPAWVLTGYVVSVVITSVLAISIAKLGIPLGLVNQAVYGLVISIVVYALTLMFVIGLPVLLKKQTVSRVLIGLTRLPSWKDILLAPAGFVIYFIASAVVMVLLAQFIPALNLNEAQDIIFKGLSEQYEFILAFLALVVIAPIAEEILFRGYLYGKLKRAVPTWVAMLMTSALFGLVHFQWNVSIDVFILSLVLCSLREVTGNISAGILLHMLKNGIAFYFLFINPLLSHTLGG